MGIADREALVKAYRDGESRIGQLREDPFKDPTGVH